MGGSNSGYTGSWVGSLAFFQGQDLRRSPKQFIDQLELRNCNCVRELQQLLPDPLWFEDIR